MMNERRQTLWMIVATLALLGVIAGAPLLAGRFQPGRTSLVSAPGRSRSPRPAPLPAVGSYENLKKLIRDSGASSRFRENPQWGLLGAAETKSSALPKAAGLFDSGAMAARADADFSRTNIQTQGVDEADIVKTDGEYIYRISNQNITITKARPAGAMKVVASIKADETPGAFSPQELYVDDRRLVVIGRSLRTRIMSDKQRAPSAPGLPDRPVSAARSEPRAGIMPPEMPVGVTKLFVYDISDKSAPRKIRETALEGDYVSSRKIGPAVYLVANKYIDGYAVDQAVNDQGSGRPAYMDSALGDEFLDIDYPAIKYFPDAAEPNYLMVAGVNLDEPDRQMQVSTYLGAGQNVYASTSNLYVAVTRYKATEPQPQEGSQTSPAPTEEVVQPQTTNTRIYKFSLNRGKVDYLAQGEAPGTILNQYSMDESGGFFRLATNTGDLWSSRMDAAHNNLYVLDGGLKVVGKLEGLAPGERIYSTRFMGDRAYVVTFKQVDPLFVIDLKNPTAPKVLGQLKIPGYSDYLHPYDDDHIIGFGKDTVAAAPDPAGGFSEPIALYQGMKIAVFDVSDVAHPVEQFKTVIGDRGTDSELLHNPKALLFDKARNLMAFPVTVMEVKQALGATPAESPGQTYGEFTFQGAYVYDISLDKGLNLKGRIAHEGRDKKGWVGMDPYGGDNIVDRALYIGDTLYTVSKAKIKANRLDNLEEIGNVDIDR